MEKLISPAFIDMAVCLFRFGIHSEMFIHLEGEKVIRKSEDEGKFVYSLFFVKKKKRTVETDENSGSGS
jgi:hypothetical protein